MGFVPKKILVYIYNTKLVTLHCKEKNRKIAQVLYTTYVVLIFYF